MAFDAYSIFYFFESNGVFEFLLPFLLVFVIFFAVLQKIQIFPSTKVNAVLSVILGLLIVTQFEIVQTMTNFLPKVSLFLVIAVMFMFLIGLFGINMTEGFSGIFLGIATLVSLFVMYWALGPSIGISNLSIPYWITDNQSLIIVLITVAVIWFVIANTNKKKRSGWEIAKKLPGDMGEAIHTLLKDKPK